jgi:hypothetical protein
MIAGRKELSKFMVWAADIKFAEFSVWDHAHFAPIPAETAWGEASWYKYHLWWT